MGRFLNAKTKIVRLLFSDVLSEHARAINRNNSFQRQYLEYNRFPEKGIKELYYILNYRATEQLETQLQSGITNPNDLFKFLFDNYGDFIQNSFTSLKFDLALQFYEIIESFENNSSTQLDKSQLFFLLALECVGNNDTIGASTYWELTINETQRVSGVPNNLNYIFTTMGSSFTTLLNPMKLAYANNPIISRCSSQYPTYTSDYQSTMTTLHDLPLLSYVSCGIRHVLVIQLFNKHFNSIQIIKAYGQELISALCVLCESLFKLNTNIQTLIPNPNKRMIGEMIDSIVHFNPGVGSILGVSKGTRTGLYANTAFDAKPLANFNTNYPTWIQNIESLSLTPNEFRAQALYCLHQLRNNVMHDLNTTIVYYQSSDLFQKTIGLLFMCVNIIRTL